MKTTTREIASIRLYELATRRSIYDKICSLEKSQWYNKDEIAERQISKLSKLLHHAYNNVPYYKKKFDSVGFIPDKFECLSQLEDIPILTKKDIRKHFASLFAKNFETNGSLDSTGGSTGGPLQFYVGAKAAEYRAARDVRFRKWYEFYIGQKKALLWGAQRDFSLKNSVYGKIQQRIFNTLELNAWILTPKSMDEFITQIGIFKPKIIEAYSHALLILVNHALENNLEDVLQIPAVITAEMVSKTERTRIESIMQSVTDRYGSREFGAIAQECSEHNGMHISAESLIIESISVNEISNNLIITDLNRYSMPFIRYETGDRGTLSSGLCKCGRHLPKIATLEGRTHDLIKTPDGRIINGTLFGMQLRYFNEVQEYRIIQHTLDRISLQLVLGQKLSKERSNLIKQSLANFLGGTVKLEIVEVKEIALSKSGKRCLVVSEL